MFLIEFNLGFQEVTENLQPIGIAEMKEKVINLSKFWQERSGCFQSSFSFAVSCLLVPKNSSSAILFQFLGMFWEREKKLVMCAVIFQTSCPKAYDNLTAFYFKKGNQMFEIWSLSLPCSLQAHTLTLSYHKKQHVVSLNAAKSKKKKKSHRFHWGLSVFPCVTYVTHSKNHSYKIAFLYLC